MKKGIRILLTILIISVLACTVAACGGTQSDIVYADIESITVDAESIASGFRVSEFDISMVKLNVKYFDTVDASGTAIPGETVQIPAKLSMVKAEDKAKLSVEGDWTITLIYGKFVIPFNLVLYSDIATNYRVSFTDDAGAYIQVMVGGVNSDYQSVAEGATPVFPSMPTDVRPDGTSFVGWRDRDTGEMYSGAGIFKDTVFVAVYAPRSYTVGFYTRIKGEEDLIDEVEVPRGGDAFLYAPEIPVVTGYENGRWENRESMRNVNEAGLRFYAIYDPQSVRIGFNYRRDGSDPRTYITVYNVGDVIDNPPPAEATDYKFVRWETAEGKAVEFPYTVVAEMTFEARYIDVRKGNVTFEYNSAGGEYYVNGIADDSDVVVIPSTIWNEDEDTHMEVSGINPLAFVGKNIREFFVAENNKYFIVDDGVLFGKGDENAEGGRVDKTELIAYPSAKADSEYTIPASVIEIAEYAFSGAKNLTTVNFPSELTTIGANAFENCDNLTSLSLPSALTEIRANAFRSEKADSALSSITFGSAISGNTLTIGDYAFSGLNRLTEITIESHISSLGKGVFYGCKSLANVTVSAGNPYFALENGILYDRNYEVLYLYPAAFSRGSSPHIATVNASCYEIMDGAFAFAPISGITLAGNVNITMRVGAYALETPTLRNVVIQNDNNVEFDDRTFGEFLPETVYYTSNADPNSALTRRLRTLFGDDRNDDYVNSGNVKYRNITEFTGDVNYGNGYIINVFDQNYLDADGVPGVRRAVRILGCNSVTDSLYIPPMLNGYPVVEIAPMAFAYNDKLVHLQLPAEVSVIGRRAFYGLPNLESVEFAAMIREIGDEAFADCPKLSALTTAEGTEIEVLGDGAFSGDELLFQNDEFTLFGNALVRYNGFATSVAIPENVDYIGPEAFTGHSEITSVDFVNTSIIGKGAFRYCEGLTKLQFPETVERIEAEAFANCGIDLAVFPTVRKDSVAIGENAFDKIATTAEDEGTVLQYADSAMITVTYYFDARNHENYSDELVLTEGRTPEDTPTQKFAGWYLAEVGSDGEPLRDTEGNPLRSNTLVTFPYRLTKDVTLIARWIDVSESSAGIKFSYDADGDYYVVSGYSGSDEYVVVPATYRGKAVREIADNAFNPNYPGNEDVKGNLANIKYFRLPNERNYDGSVSSTLYRIGENAFTGTQWYENVKGDFVIIDDFLIKYKSDRNLVDENKAIGKVIVPEGISRIAAGAFAGVGSITSVKLPDSLTELEKDVFRDCANLVDVNLPNMLLTIAEGVFNGCEKLSYVSFENCPGLSSIAYDAFDGTAWLKNYVDDTVIINNILYKYRGKSESLHIYNGITSISERAFYNNSTLKSVYLPQSLVSIGSGAFEFDKVGAESSQLTAVYLYAGGSSLATIMDRAFKGCSMLTTLDLTLANNLVYIGDEAFYGCALRNVVIPDSVENLGEGAFAGCFNLNRVSFESGSRLTVLGAHAFENCVSLFSVTFLGLSALKEIAPYAFYECSQLSAFSCPMGSIEVIGEMAFYHCTQLKTFESMESALREVGADALEGVGYVDPNSSTEMVVLGNILIDYTGHDSVVTIPANITTIYNGAFRDNTRITNIIFPENSAIRNINDYAFYGCINLAEINFPSSITYVGDHVVDDTAWYNRQSEEEEFVVISNTLIKYTERLRLKEVVLPENVQVINPRAFEGSVFYDVLITSAITKICDGAFDGANVGDKSYVFADWTITMDCGEPPELEMGKIEPLNPDVHLPQPTKIYVTDPDQLDAYRLDNSWVNLYEQGKVEAVEYYEVRYVVPDGYAEKIESDVRFIMYDDKEVTVLQDEDGYDYIFLGWYLDAGPTFKQSVTYPFRLTSSVTLYAWIVSNKEGSNPENYYVEGLEDGATDLKIVDYTIESEASDSGARRIVIISTRGDGQIIREIGEGAFAKHEELREVYFNATSQISVIGEGAFENCLNLERIILPGTISRIDEGAFRNCPSLREIVFTDVGAELRLGDSVFEGCGALEAITFPKGLKELGVGVFKDCPNLKDLYLTGEPFAIDEDNILFDEDIIDGLTVHIPYGTASSFQSLWSRYEGCLEEEPAPSVEEGEEDPATISEILLAPVSFEKRKVK